MPDGVGEGQTWKSLLFAHWPVAPESLSAVMPPQPQPDPFDGRAWIAVTSFPRAQPAPAAHLPAARSSRHFPRSTSAPTSRSTTNPGSTCSAWTPAAAPQSRPRAASPPALLPRADVDAGAEPRRVFRHRAHRSTARRSAGKVPGGLPAAQAVPGITRHARALVDQAPLPLDARR